MGQRTFDADRLDPWVINLDHRTDRWEAMQVELRKVRVKARRFSAFTRDDWREPLSAIPLMLESPGGKPHKTVGNWLSHTFLMRTVAGTDRDLLVLEDDVFLAPDFWCRIGWIEQHLDVPWDVIFLCGTFHVRPPQWHPEIGRDVEVTHMKHLLRAYGCWSNHGYVVNGRSAGRVLAAMREVMPRARGSDHALILAEPKLNCYVFVPGMVFQRDSRGDIGEGLTRFSLFRKMGPYVYQDRLDDFDPLAFDWGEAAVSVPRTKNEWKRP
jgi:GR25 family glycosyltransferase involved in LPS biosynthesis